MSRPYSVVCKLQAYVSSKDRALDWFLCPNLTQMHVNILRVGGQACP